MCSKQNRRFKNRLVQHDYRNQKTLAKHVSCKYNCKFGGRKCNSNQNWNNDKCWCECIKYHKCERDYISNPAICSCENGKYLASIINNAVIMCDEIIDAETKTVTTNFNEKMQPVKQKKLCFTFRFINYHCIIDSC